MATRRLMVVTSHSSLAVRWQTALRFAAAAGLLLAAHGGSASEPSAGKLTGRVTDEQGKPVAGALVRVLVSPGGYAADESRIRRVKTDADGHYAVEIPLGHATCLGVMPPGGYYWDGLQFPSFATSREKPAQQLDFKVRNGSKVLVSLDDDKLKNGAKMLLLNGRGKVPFTFLSESLEDGLASVTVPAAAGTFEFIVLSQEHRPLARSRIDLPEGFDLLRVEKVSPIDAGTFEILDTAGRRGRVERAQPIWEDGQLALHLRSDSVGAGQRTVRVTGSVVNEQDRPLENAEVRLGFASSVATSSSMTVVRTSPQGSFLLDAQMLDEPGQKPRSIFLIVTRDGFAGVVTSPRQVPGTQQSLEFPTIRLAQGRSLSVRVVDEAGNPLEGAWVQPGDAYLSATNAMKTDRQGRCQLRDLPADVMQVSASFGSLVHNSKIVVSGQPEAAKEVTLEVREVGQNAVQAQPFPDPPPLGAIAPEWSVVAWTDGQQRKLSDYRGKIVVIDFWGVWCSACMNALPAVRQLAAKYANRSDVVFLGIHSAGTDMDQVKELQRLKNWTLVTGLDQGSEITEGATARAYGARGWPTTVIIDREGKIAYNSNLEKWNALSIYRENSRIAKAMGLAPEKPDASAEERLERMNAMNVFRESELIDRVLDPK